MGIGRYLIGQTGKYASATAGGVAAAGAVIGNGKGYAGKLGDGLESLTEIRNLVPAVVKAGEAARAYDSLPARQFVERYGPDFQNMMNSMGNAVDNITKQPIDTAAAALTFMAAAYVIGRAIGFWQHKGQGGVMTRLERKLGNRMWPETRPY